MCCIGTCRIYSMLIRNKGKTSIDGIFIGTFVNTLWSYHTLFITDIKTTNASSHTVLHFEYNLYSYLMKYQIARNQSFIANKHNSDENAKWTKVARVSQVYKYFYFRIICKRKTFPTMAIIGINVSPLRSHVNRE